jgi:nitrite reductase (NADH) large subunit
VGSGIAAVRAAEAIRTHDARAQVTLLTREKCLPYHRMNLTRYLDGDVDAASTLLHSPSWYEDHGIEVRLETDVVEIASRDHSVRTRTRDFSYDRLVLATGARVAVPLVRQIWIQGVRPLRTLSDCARILEVAGFGRKVVVLGSGPLGVETAVALRRRSCEVVVVERADGLLQRQLDGAASLLLQRHLEGLGIRVLLSRHVEAIEGDEYAESVRLDNGLREPTDLVVVATGIVPNTGLATGAGLRVNHGVLVDDALQTSAPDIYAAGDVAEHRGRTHGSWNAAWEMGSVAGANAAGGAETYFPTLQPRVLKIVGMDVCSLGKIVAEPGTGRELVHAEERGAIYQKVVLDEGRVVGGVFLGDTHPVAAVRKAIQDGRDVSSAWENARSLPHFLASLETPT